MKNKIGQWLKVKIRKLGWSGMYGKWKGGVINSPSALLSGRQVHKLPTQIGQKQASPAEVLGTAI